METILTALFCFITVALLGIAVITWNIIPAIIGMGFMLIVAICSLVARVLD